MTAATNCPDRGQAPARSRSHPPSAPARQRPFAVPLALLLLAAACAQPARLVPPDGNGAAEAEMRAVETTGRTGLRVLGLTQGRVRACSGSYDPPTPLSPVRTTELACTGGVAGTATVGPDFTGGRSVRWELETGESGRTPL